MNETENIYNLIEDEILGILGEVFNDLD